MTPSDAADLARRWQQDHDVRARNRLVEAHLNLVDYVAKRRPEGPSTARRDLYQEGVFGLIRACDTFDPEKAGFSTYAMWWVRTYVDRAIAHDRLAGKTGTEATRGTYTLATQMREQVKSNALHGWRSREAPVALQALEAHDVHEPYLDLHGLERRADAEGIPGRGLRAPEPEEEPDIFVHLPAVLRALSLLPPREQEIVRGRQDGVTLEELGRRMELTRERVRQIEKRAMREIRHYQDHGVMPERKPVGGQRIPYRMDRRRDVLRVLARSPRPVEAQRLAAMYPSEEQKAVVSMLQALRAKGILRHPFGKRHLYALTKYGRACAGR